MAVRIRMKRLGRKNRPFYRICAIDSRQPRDGRVIEELGTYDPLVSDVDARCVLDGERVAYWLGVGALASEKVSTLIKKYGQNGTNLEQAKAAQEKRKVRRPLAMASASAPMARKPQRQAKGQPQAGAAPQPHTGEAAQGESAPAGEAPAAGE